MSANSYCTQQLHAKGDTASARRLTVGSAAVKQDAPSASDADRCTDRRAERCSSLRGSACKRAQLRQSAERRGMRDRHDIDALGEDDHARRAELACDGGDGHARCRRDGRQHRHCLRHGALIVAGSRRRLLQRLGASEVQRHKVGAVEVEHGAEVAVLACRSNGCVAQLRVQRRRRSNPRRRIGGVRETRKPQLAGGVNIEPQPPDCRIVAGGGSVAGRN